MPISSGMEACFKILKLFNESQKHLRPLMTALTANVTDAIERECFDCGFELVIMQPLSVDKIQEILIPKILDRRHRIERQEKLDSQIALMMSKGSRVSQNKSDHRESSQ